MMIASVLTLDRHAVKELRITDRYSLHRIVYDLYPDIRTAEDKAASKSSGILFADQGGDISGRKILMLANRKPTDRIKEKYGQVNSRPIGEGFLEHSQYQFKVMVNPTRRCGASRKLQPVKERKAIAEWFCERGVQSWGFKVDPHNVEVVAVDVLQFNDKQKNPITIAQASVQGQLTVTDRQQFHKSFTQGVGRARAFGCGLLQIVPILDNPFA